MPMRGGPFLIHILGHQSIKHRGSKMDEYYRDILIDQRTSCTRDEGTAILLGRRSLDPIYRDFNPGGDPDEVHEQFMEWLDISIFGELVDERDGLLSELDDVLEENSKDKIDACRERIVRFDETIRRAKLILCDIDDELAKGTASQLRKDQAATEKSGHTHITLSSLSAWAKTRDYSTAAVEPSPTQDAPSARNGPGSEEPLLNAKGGMTATATKGLLVTFAVLLEDYLKVTGKKYIAESGTALNEEALAKHLSQMSLPGARQDHFLKGQSVSTIETRIKEVIGASGAAVMRERAKARKSK